MARRAPGAAWAASVSRTRLTVAAHFLRAFCADSAVRQESGQSSAQLPLSLGRREFLSSLDSIGLINAFLGYSGAADSLCNYEDMFHALFNLQNFYVATAGLTPEILQSRRLSLNEVMHPVVVSPATGGAGTLHNMTAITGVSTGRSTRHRRLRPRTSTRAAREPSPHDCTASVATRREIFTGLPKPAARAKPLFLFYRLVDWTLDRRREPRTCR